MQLLVEACQPAAVQLRKDSYESERQTHAQRRRALKKWLLRAGALEELYVRYSIWLMTAFTPAKNRQYCSAAQFT